MPRRSMKSPEQLKKEQEERGLAKERAKENKYLTGGQAKIAKKAPPFDKIDEKDFAVLRAEKAKGRGKGLQDEKVKPGKVMKAALGAAALGLGAKKMKKKGMMLPVGFGMTSMKAKKMKEILGRKRGGMNHGKVMKAKRGRLTFDDKFKMQEKGIIDKKTGKLSPAHESFFKKTPRSKIEIMAKTGVNPDLPKAKPGPFTTKKQIEKNLETTKKEASRFLERRKKLSGRLPIPKGGKIGAAAAAVAATAAGIKKFMEKRKENKKKKMGGGLAAATERLKAQGKMGGGMMKKYNTGGDANTMKNKDRLTESDIQKAKRLVKSPRQKALNVSKTTMAILKGARDFRSAYNRDKAKVQKRMGGGMMMNKPMGYKSGKSIKVKCKLGRNKPTKMY